MPGRVSPARISSAEIPATEIVLTGTEKPDLFLPVSDETRPEANRKVASMSEPVTITDFTIAPGVREMASEDGAVLLDIEQGVCFSVNPVGLRIWELITKRYSVEQIADALGQEFSLPRSQLLVDVTEFIRGLETHRLVRRPGHNAVRKPWYARLGRTSPRK